MAIKKRVSKPIPSTANEVEPTEPEVVRCTAWCFLPGISHIGPVGLLQCILSEDHVENDLQHQIQVDILSPPSGRFTINWTTV